MPPTQASFTTSFPTSLALRQWVALEPGPRLIVLGAVHGNETCGTQALVRLIAELEAGHLRLARGTLSVVPVCNPLAYQRGQRQGERNLNRRLIPTAQPRDFEDHVANVLCPWLAAHDVLLDLHSFHTPGTPFAMLGPPNNAGTLEPFTQAAAEETLARHLGPQRLVEGWLETYAHGVVRRRQRRAQTGAGQGLDPSTSTLCDAAYGVGTTEYMRTQGGYGVTLECGHHTDPAAPEVAYRATRQALAVLGLVDEPPEPARTDHEVLRLCDVTDRHHPEDRLARPWSSFDPVSPGDLLGTRHDGTELRAPSDGFIVFPNPTAMVGAEWFYFARRSVRVWE